jgi:uncharacterized protein with GYD domain
MPAYIHLVKYTQQAMGDIKGGAKRRQEAKARAEKMGIRNIGFWTVMGEYDAVSIWEAPDDQTFAAFTLSAASQGYIKTQTLKAFSEEEFAQIVGKLP